MPGLIAPDCVRYTVNGTYATRPVANIIDMILTTTIGGGDRDECVADQATRLVSAWADEMLDNISDDYTATSVSWVDLNTDSGTVGETSTGSGTDFPASGAASSDPMPGNVAYRVNKHITAARGQRQGRMYLVGVPESSTTAGAPNTVVGADITAINADLAAFKTAVEQDPTTTTLDYNSFLCVIHTLSTDNPSPPPQKLFTFEGASLITSMTLDATLATQRRRLRG